MALCSPCRFCCIVVSVKGTPGVVQSMAAVVACGSPGG